jgi:hypothetical protein
MQATKTMAIEPAIQIHQNKKEVLDPLLKPLADNDFIIRVWKNFNDLKLKLLDDSDFVNVRGEKLAKKSAFRKLALAFGISTEILREERVIINEKDAYLVSVRAIAPNGRFMTSVGSCHEAERKFNKPSDVRAIAETRATNRAIANLLGWATPSAEEMIVEDDIEQDTEIGQSVERDENQMSDRQKKLLTQLILQRNPDPEERENALVMIEGLSKVDASSLISSMLKQEA